MQFSEVLFDSKSVRRYMQLENMSANAMIELYFDCFHSYLEMFAERLKYGSFLRKVISAYNPIDGFAEINPDKLIKTMLNSRHMQVWFAYRMWAEIDRQIMNNSICKDELLLSMSFTGVIPKTETMKKILEQPKGTWIHIDSNYKVSQARSSKLEAQS